MAKGQVPIPIKCNGEEGAGQQPMSTTDQMFMLIQQQAAALMALQTQIMYMQEQMMSREGARVEITKPLIFSGEKEKVLEFLDACEIYI